MFYVSVEVLRLTAVVVESKARNELPRGTVGTKRGGTPNCGGEEKIEGVVAIFFKILFFFFLP